MIDSLERSSINNQLIGGKSLVLVQLVDAVTAVLLLLLLGESIKIKVLFVLAVLKFMHGAFRPTTHWNIFTTVIPHLSVVFKV